MNHVKKTNIKVEFIIYRVDGADFDFDCVTKALFPEPIEVKKSEEQGIDTKMDHSCWMISLGPVVSRFVEEELQKVIDMIKDKEEEIIQLQDTLNLECKFDIVAESWNDEQPSIYFDEELLRFVSNIKAEIAIDLYNY